MSIPASDFVAYREQSVITGLRAARAGLSPEALGQRFGCDWCAETGYGWMFLRLGPGWFEEAAFPGKHTGRAGLTAEVPFVFISAAVGESKSNQDTGTPPNLVRIGGPTWLGKGFAWLWGNRTTAILLGIPSGNDPPGCAR